MGKIYILLAASSAPVTVKLSSIDPVYTVKIFPVYGTLKLNRMITVIIKNLISN
jgi:hypothetical protein